MRICLFSRIKQTRKDHHHPSPSPPPTRIKHTSHMVPKNGVTQHTHTTRKCISHPKGAQVNCNRLLVFVCLGISRTKQKQKSTRKTFRSDDICFSCLWYSPENSLYSNYILVLGKLRFVFFVVIADGFVGFVRGVFCLSLRGCLASVCISKFCE